MAFALRWDASKWLRVKPANGDPYYTSLSVTSIAHGLVSLGHGVFCPAIVVFLLAVLALAWVRDRKVYLAVLAAIAFGVSALLPNATLPNHLEPQYSCLGVFFILTPCLLLTYLIPRQRLWRFIAACAVVLVYSFTLLSYEGAAHGEAGWVARQEGSTLHLLSGLQEMKRISAPFESSLVSGIVAPYNPFRVPDYPEMFFGAHRFWTVVVPADTPERTTATLRLIHKSNPVRLQPYAHWFWFSSDERLVGVVDHPSASALAPELPPDELQTQVTIARTLPAAGSVSFYAFPNPVKSIQGKHPHTTVYWSAPVNRVEVRVGSPSGPLFANGGSSGQATTDDWLAPNMTFYLIGLSGSPKAASHSLAELKIEIVK